MRIVLDDVQPVATATVSPAVRAATPTAKVTEAYDYWWRFACERQEVYYRRLRGEAAPWTDDPVLGQYRFTNAYRAADRVSQYLIKNVIYSEGLPQSPNEVVFRVLLFKLFNRIETWEALRGDLSTVALADDPFARIDAILAGELAAGRPIYSAAYIMPPSRSRRGGATQASDALGATAKDDGRLPRRSASGCADHGGRLRPTSVLSNDRRFPRLPIHHRHQLQ